MDSIVHQKYLLYTLNSSRQNYFLQVYGLIVSNLLYTYIGIIQLGKYMEDDRI